MTTKYIFDLDGTLYSFKGGPDFTSSTLNADIRKNIFDFLEHEAHIPHDFVENEYLRLKRVYSGQISIGVEREYKIDRNRYFCATWDLSPEKYIVPTDDPLLVMGPLRGRVAVLTEAPRIWAEKALKFLGVHSLVGELLFTGEPDLRKPSKEAFVRVGKKLGVPFPCVCSVGDQENSDILPAKAIGMRTVRIGEGVTEADYRIAKLINLKELPLD